EVVADLVVDRGFQLPHGRLPARIRLAAELLVLPADPLPAAENVDAPPLRDGHEPGSRVFRDARLRPALESRHESVLAELLGEAPVPDHPCEAGDQLRRLDSPDSLDPLAHVSGRHAADDTIVDS